MSCKYIRHVVSVVKQKCYVGLQTTLFDIYNEKKMTTLGCTRDLK